MVLWGPLWVSIAGFGVHGDEGSWEMTGPGIIGDDNYRLIDDDIVVAVSIWVTMWV